MPMKRIVFALLAFVLACMPLSACAEVDLQAALRDTYAYACDGASLQDWIDGELAGGVGSAADNYILNLCHTRHGLNLDGYIRAAAEKLQQGEISNPVTRMRCALILLACGAGDQLPADLADESIGKLGVMSYVYGLHLLKNGAQSQLWTREAIVEKLLEMQKEDGGWAVMGQHGDVDVTAMCLQALAGFTDLQGVKEAVERAVELLAARQLESAGFSSNGNENSESASQVLIALASLGIDPAQDARFIKNGRTIVDALLEYRQDDGGFAHLPGEDANATASVQAAQAITALLCIPEPYFDFTGEAVLASPEGQASPSLPAWKLWALSAVGVFLIAGCIFALVRKHGRAKRLLFVLIAAILVSALILTLDIETPERYYTAEVQGESAGSVYLSIRCDTVAGASEDGNTPESGEILARTQLSFSEGDSVFDALTNAARQFRIHMEYEGGTGDFAYVNGINHLYEYSYGDLSGWVYTVNGVRHSVGCGAYLLSDGDEIVWHYTSELGEDIS